MSLVWWPSDLRCWYQFLAHLWCDPHMSWAHNCSGSYPGYFMSSFHLYISFHWTLCVACVPLESPLAYNMYVFNLRIANHILIKLFFYVTGTISLLGRRVTNVYQCLMWSSIQEPWDYLSHAQPSGCHMVDVVVTNVTNIGVSTMHTHIPLITMYICNHIDYSVNCDSD